MSEIVFDHDAVAAALDRICARMQGEEIAIVGIQRGGARVADALAARLQQRGSRIIRGNLDISFYRDDLDTIGPNPQVHPSDLDFDISDREIWLVDDVLYTGRTIRAAMDELFDYGRPSSIRLAVLLDRGGRELPICSDIAGLEHTAPADCTVELITGDGDWYIEQRVVK